MRQTQIREELWALALAGLWLTLVFGSYFVLALSQAWPRIDRLMGH